MDGLRTEVEDTAADRHGAGAEHAGAGGDAQETGVDGRTTGVSAAAIQLPGTGAILHQGQGAAGRIVEDVAEEVVVGISARERHRAAAGPGHRQRGVIPEQHRRPGSARGIDHGAHLTDGEHAVGAIISPARAFEAQGAHGRRRTDDEIAGGAGAGETEAAGGAAVGETRDGEGTLIDQHRSGESIGARQAPRTRAVLGHSGLADVHQPGIETTVVRDDRREHVGGRGGAARTGQREDAVDRIGNQGPAERAGVRELQRLTGRSGSIEGEITGGDGEKTVGRIHAGDAVAHPSEGGIGAENKAVGEQRAGAERAILTAVGETRDPERASGQSQRPSESIGGVQQPDAAGTRATDDQRAPAGDDSADEERVGGIIGPSLVASDDEADVGVERRDTGGCFERDP